MAVPRHLTPNGLFVRRAPSPRMTHPQVAEFPLNLIYKQWLFDATDPQPSAPTTVFAFQPSGGGARHKYDALRWLIVMGWQA